MAGIEAFLKGWVSRMLPQPEQDNDPGIVRLGRFGDVWTIGAVRKQHALADEGSYFVANNAQTGIAMGTPVGFVATTPVAIIANVDTAGNQSSKRLHVDYATLVATAAGGAASTLASVPFAVVLDQGNRYSSGGTELSNNIVCPNSDAPVRASVAKVYFGAITATAATASARTVVGQRFFRPFISATVANVVGDEVVMNFGGVESPGFGSITVASMVKQVHSCPPIVIGPGQCALIYVWLAGATTPAAISALPEFGWWER